MYILWPFQLSWVTARCSFNLHCLNYHPIGCYCYLRFLVHQKIIKSYFVSITHFSDLTGNFLVCQYAQGDRGILTACRIWSQTAFWGRLVELPPASSNYIFMNSNIILIVTGLCVLPIYYAVYYVSYFVPKLYKESLTPKFNDQYWMID